MGQLKMYFLLKMRIFQPAMLVYQWGRHCRHLKIKLFLSDAFRMRHHWIHRIGYLCVSERALYVPNEKECLVRTADVTFGYIHRSSLFHRATKVLFCMGDFLMLIWFFRGYFKKHIISSHELASYLCPPWVSTDFITISRLKSPNSLCTTIAGNPSLLDLLFRCLYNHPISLPKCPKPQTKELNLNILRRVLASRRIRILSNPTRPVISWDFHRGLGVLQLAVKETTNQPINQPTNHPCCHLAEQLQKLWGIFCSTQDVRLNFFAVVLTPKVPLNGEGCWRYLALGFSGESCINVGLFVRIKDMIKTVLYILWDSKGEFDPSQQLL